MISASADPYLPPGERQEVLRQLDACDDELEELRRSDTDEKRQQLLVCLETGLHLRRKLYAENSQEVATAARHLCEACNFAATRMLQSDNLKGARELLKRAEQVADKSDAGRAITFNNLACYYRRTGKLRSAVTFLERALAIEENAANPEAAQTHLNLCATLSQLQRHADALYHAQSAVIWIYETLAPRMMAGDLDGGGRDDGADDLTVLCIAYHNLGVEHEYLKNYVGALSAYTSGMRWADRFLDRDHQLLGILRESADGVKAKLPQGCGALLRADDLARWPGRSGGRRPESRSSDGSARIDQLMTPRGGGDNLPPHAEEDSDRDRDRDN